MRFAVYNGLGRFPEDIYRFLIPIEGIRCWDDEALVYDVWMPDPAGEGPGTGLRHYAFYQRWFVVNVSFEAGGSLRTEFGHGIDWCYNCDIVTPLFSIGDTFYSTDLELDVLAEPDGRTHIVKDEEVFARSVAAGYISAEEETGARLGLTELLGYVNGSGGLGAFLETICPLATLQLPSTPQPPVVFPPLADVPLLLPEARRSRYGRRLPVGTL